MSICRLLSVFTLLCWINFSFAEEIIISTASGSLQMGFDTTTGELTTLNANQYEFLSAPASWWKAVLVDSTSQYTITLHDAQSVQYYVDDSPTMYIAFKDINVGGLGLVTVNISVLDADSPINTLMLAFRYEITTDIPKTIGLWSFTFSIPGLSSSADDTLIIPYSYGQRYINPLTSRSTAWSGDYPSSTASYQMFSFYHNIDGKTTFPSSASGLYVAAHDSTASAKTFFYNPNTTSKSVEIGITIPTQDSSYSFADGCATSIKFNFVIALYTGDWWDGAQIYREFALTTPWTAAGPIETRTGDQAYPQWFLDTTMWLNTGWARKDIFNDTQGDPDVVLDRIGALYKRFNLPTIALHWYVFQASNKFDANYPVYEPVKAGFGEAVKQLQNMGVNVAPYINGRIFDMDLDKWTKDNAVNSASMTTDGAHLGRTLSIKTEDYGNGVTFAPMCPYTEYWQGTLVDVVADLVQNYSVKGTYLDQIGAGSPGACWNPDHKHTLGGGSYWVDGYHTLLGECRQVAGPDVAFVTESNAEPYMGQLNGQLTLTAMGVPASGEGSELSSGFVPVFTSVYAGYIIGFGAVYELDEFVNSTLVFNTRLANEMIHGHQIGWFSVTSNSYKPYQGLYDVFMSEEYDDQVDYIRRLARMRGTVKDYVLYGQEMRPIPFNVTSSQSRAEPVTVEFGCPEDCHTVTATSPRYLTSTWLRTVDKAQSLMVLIVNPAPDAKTTVSLSFTINVADFGVSTTSTQKFTLTQVTFDGRRKLVGTYPAGAVEWQASNLPGSFVIALEIEAAQSQLQMMSE